jgi:transcriptional regulator with XRE-family HTH domain
MGLTLGDLGAALGLANGNFVGMVERNERMPSDERLMQIADLLQLNGRDLLALKYQQARGTAAEVLLAPPPPQFPRLRRLLLGSCSNKDEMAAEFALSERSALERVVLQALLEYVFLPALANDRFAPKRIRDRVRSHQRRAPTEPLDPWILEEEAESFVPWARENLQSWSFDLPDLTLRIRHSESPGDVSTIPLVDRELRRRMLASVEDKGPAPLPSPAPPPSLAELLADEGLPEADVDEILELVEFKKMRAQRSG